MKIYWRSLWEALKVIAFITVMALVIVAALPVLIIIGLIQGAKA